MITGCSATSGLFSSGVKVDKERLEETVQASNGCEWSVKMAPPPEAVKALRKAQDEAPEERKFEVRAFRERIVEQDTNYKKNCEKEKTDGRE